MPFDEYAEAIKLRNLYKALRKCCAGTMWKDGTALYRSDGLENSVKLRQDYLTGAYKLQRYMRFKISRPKPRDITATRIRDRHGQRSACDNVLYAVLTRSFIHDNGACQRGMGVDYTIERVKYWLRRIYCKQRQERAKAAGCRIEAVGPFQPTAKLYKGDVKKYFPSTLHRNAKAIICKAISSPKLAAIFCAVVESFGEDWWGKRALALGASEQAVRKAARAINDARTEREYLPIRPETQQAAIAAKCARQIGLAVDSLGLTCENRARMQAEAEGDEARGIGLGSQMSQLVQLAQLNAIDHYVKETARIAVYVRYMDDFLLYDPDEAKLEKAVQGVAAMLGELGLELNPKSQYVHLRKGFIFLRWHFYVTPTGKIILKAAQGVAANEKRRLHRMAGKVAEGKGTVASLKSHYEGWRAHIACGNTRELLRGMDKYFADLLEKAGGQEREENTMMQPNEQTRLARAEAIANQQRAALPDVQQEALQAAISAGDLTTAADIARAIRNRLLSECDAEVALDRLGLTLPSGSTFTAWLAFLRQLGEALVSGWATYRQQLRDLPTSAGWPDNIVWPVAPGSEDGDHEQP